MDEKFTNKLSRQKYNEQVSKLLIYLLLIPTLTNFATGAFFNWSSQGVYATYVLYLIAFIILVKNIFIYNRIIAVKLLFIMTLIIVFVLINFLYVYESRVYFLENSTLLFIVYFIYIPLSIMLTKITCWDYFFKKMRTICTLGITIIFIGILFLDFGEHILYMSFALMLLPHVLLAFYFGLKYHKSYFIFFLIGFLLQLGYGGRMSLFSVLIFIVLLIIIEWKKIKNRVKYGIMVMLAFTVVTLLFINDILIMILVKTQNFFNWDSYIIDKLKKSEVSSSKTRDALYETARDLISRQGLDWYGLFGDRIVFHKIGWEIPYVHNFFYEILLTFGLILGSIIIIIILYKISIGLITGETERRVVVAFFTCLIFLRLMVSSSFLIEGNFFLMLGVLWNRNTIKKNNIHSRSIQK